MFKGKEIKQLVLVSTLCCVLLIVSMSLFLVSSSRRNLREQTDSMKMAMAEQIASRLQGCYASMSEYLMTNRGMEFAADDLQAALANIDELLGFFNDSILGTYDADFVIYRSSTGKVVASAKPGLEVPDISLDVTAGEEDYVILNELEEKSGTFFILVKPGIFPGDEVILGIDNTDQVDTIKQAYEDEKSRMVRQQVIGVGILFLLILAFSVVIIYLFINHLLRRPMERLNEEARDLIRGKPSVEEEVREGSIFANLQRLLNSGRTILGRAAEVSTDDDGTGESLGNREVNKVIAVWTLVTTVIFLVSTVILLLSSIALMNTRTDDIVESVGQEMASYYSSAYDSIVGYAKANTGAYVGSDIWDPDFSGDRLESIERLTIILRYAFNCDAAVTYLETPSGGVYLASVREGVELKDKPANIGKPITVHEGYYEPGDLVMVMMNPVSYPGFGENQFEYYIVNVTPQASVLEDLYQSSSSSLLEYQLLLSLVFLLLCLALSPLAMAWATRQYITKPIIELDAASERLMEGDLGVEITIDDKSSFSGIQRLLVRAQELLESMT